MGFESSEDWAEGWADNTAVGTAGDIVERPLQDVEDVRRRHEEEGSVKIL